MVKKTNAHEMKVILDQEDTQDIRTSKKILNLKTAFKSTNSNNYNFT